MYEFHGWFRLSQTTEESDVGQLHAIIDELNEMIAGLDFPTNVSAEVTVLNGEYHLLLHGVANRRRDEAAGMRQVLKFVARRLPGSYGLLYEKDEEMPVPPGPNAFLVHVMARGDITERLDPFLSPLHPVVED
ncbi:Imm7 family immunity protein [Verrucosispora sp. WMMA2121]|uniref:Imm7 family immunity protein n=1 Tax=Verrucosispora sp. WMMA2121 TaxID=3015164 RepID=UPI0022B5E6CA|nr:Imm7 family immunity protein [Verrucosispora sp. WMMA2121]MCZ7421214.1 Imm7 family immunity protein [Verrucosispora sp. WMMA2121]